MRRDLSPYEPLTLRGRVPDLYPFRMVRLNLAGWSALLGATTALGVAVTMVTGHPLAGFLVGGLLPVSAVGTDRLRWRSSRLSLGMDSDELAQQLVGLLAAKGIAARAESVQWDDEEEVQHSVIVRQRDHKAASAALRQLGDASNQ